MGCDTVLLKNLVVFFNCCPVFVVYFFRRMLKIGKEKVSLTNYRYIDEIIYEHQFIANCFIDF